MPVCLLDRAVEECFDGGTFAASGGVLKPQPTFGQPSPICPIARGFASNFWAVTGRRGYPCVEAVCEHWERRHARDVAKVDGSRIRLHAPGN